MVEEKKLCFVVDPVEYDSPETSTTMALIYEAYDKGYDVRILYPWDYYVQDGSVKGIVRGPNASYIVGVEDYAGYMQEDLSKPVRAKRFGPKYPTFVESIELEQFDAIFLRANPPNVNNVKGTFSERDVAYRFRVLERDNFLRYMALVGESTLVVNDPIGVVMAVDKSFLLHLPKKLIPKTYLSKEVNRILGEIVEGLGKIVVKPTQGFGGTDVLPPITKEMLRNPDFLVRSLLVLTNNESSPVMVQEYLGEIDSKGEKRILLLDGKPIGAYKRVPPGEGKPANLCQGGEARKYVLTDDDLSLCERISPILQRYGLFFVGLDVVGDKITEVNVQSPGGIIKCNKFNSGNLEKVVIDTLIEKIDKRKK